MLRTLRGRLILSHVFPLLLIVPVVGIALIYALETRVLLPNLAKELMGQASIIAELASDRPDLWSDPGQSQAFVVRTSRQVSARVMLIGSDSRLLASSSPVDADYVGQVPQIPGLDNALAGLSYQQTRYSMSLNTEIADVLLPVFGENGRVLGVVRLSFPLTSVYARFLELRYLVVAILVAGLLLGGMVGWILALDLAQPLQGAARRMLEMAEGRRLELLPEQGPAEIRSLAAAFNTLVGRLHALEENRRHLLAHLVHEIARPLGAIRAAIQALKDGAAQDPELSAELLSGVDGQTHHLERLLDDLTGLYEQAAGGFKLSLRSIPTTEWLRQVIAPWREAAREHGLTWEASIPDDLPAVQVDPDRLAQVLGNLLSNAIKYTPPGGKVALAAGASDQEVWLRVSDTGPGISPEDRQHLFTPFYRGQIGRRFPQGMGLGLSIARDLVVAHGGRLELDTAPGQGTHLTVWLPRS